MYVTYREEVINMPLQDGAKVTLWTFDDRGSYALADASTQTFSDNKYQTDFSNRVLIVDEAYKRLKGVDLPEKKDDSKRHVAIHVADGKYKRTLANGTEIDQAPISIQKKWNNNANRGDWTIKIWCAEIINEKGNDKPKNEKKVEESAENVTPTEETSQPTEQPKANNGFVGLDFLNIPEGYNPNLPFT